MHDKHAPILKAICSSAAPPARRLPYSPPALRLYGKVKHMTEGSGGMGNDGGGLMTKMSDRNTKENIVKIGEHPLGIGLYLFDYRAEFRDATKRDSLPLRLGLILLGLLLTSVALR